MKQARSGRIAYLLIAAALSIVWSARAVPRAEAPQYFVAFPPGLARPLATNLLVKSLELVTNVTSGSTVTYFQAIDFREIAHLEISGDPNEYRLQDPAVAGALLEVRKYLLFNSPQETNFSGQLQLPRLVSEIEARRLPRRNAVLVLVGDPRLESVYPAEKAWSMKTGLVPGDGILRTRYPDTPWGVQGRNALRDSTVHWLIDRPNWMMSSAHEQRVKRFLHLWFALQGSAGLCSFFGDSDRVFGHAARQVAVPVMAAELSSDFSFTMLTDARPVTLITNASILESSELSVAQPPVVDRPRPAGTLNPAASGEAVKAIRQANLLFSSLHTNQLGIAVVWFSDDPKADVDLWVRPRRASESGQTDQEISFKQPQIPGGRLHQDLRSSVTDAQTPDFTETAWEAVTLDDPDFHELTVWLNVFATSKPLSGLVRAYYRGRSVDVPFRFEISAGDGAGNRSTREQGPAWLKVELATLVPRP